MYGQLPIQPAQVKMAGSMPVTGVPLASSTHKPALNDEDESFYRKNEGYFTRNQQYARPGPYITHLEPQQESAFRKWVTDNKIPYNPDEKGNSGYDMRGFWKAAQAGDPRAHTGIDPVDHHRHFTDYWKTPYHESFNHESMYSLPGNPYHWTYSGAGGPDDPALLGPGGTVILPRRRH